MRQVKLYYDGDCPFCSRYSKLQEIRKCINLQLLDARKDLSWKEFNQELDLDNGVILIDFNSNIYQGVEAINYLNKICRFQGFFFILQKWIFSKKLLSNIVYFIFKTLRKIALKFK